MTVQELIQLLSSLPEDQKQLKVAVVVGENEYWGTIYGSPSTAEVRVESVNGPKNLGEKCVVIERKW